jgi:hypothetical protein
MDSKISPFPFGLGAGLILILSAIILFGGAPSDRLLAQPENTDETPAGAEAAKGLYLEDQVTAAQKKNLNNIITILREGKFDGKKNDFETYYKTYALARWTQLSTLNNLRDFHKELFSNLKQAKSGEVHDYLNKLVLEYMIKLAKENYHPAVRVNAILTIGDLNSVDSMGGQEIPWPDAVPVLLETINDPKQIVPVKVAALVGINRHVTAGINDPPTQAQISAALLKLLAGLGAANYDDAGQTWIRKRVIDILGALGNVGANNQVAKLLSGYAGDSKAPFFLRSSAAQSLGKLKYAQASGLNAVDLAKSLAQYMLDACGAELGAEGTAADRQRRMKALLASAMMGLQGDDKTFKGIMPLATAPAQTSALKNLQSIFDTLLKTIDKDVSKLSEDNAQKYIEDFKKAVEDCQGKLKDWLANPK